MKITIKHGKTKKVVHIPTSWKEVRFSQFLEISESLDDPVVILSVFTGLDKEIIRSSKIENAESIILMLGFLKGALPIDIPKTILGYTIPHDLAFESIGQFEDLKTELRAVKDYKDHIRKFPLYCAIYCCPQKHGEYDWKKAEEMAKEFYDAPAGEVLAIGNFTLVKLAALNRNIPIRYQKAATAMMKKALAFRSWIRYLGSTVRYFSWKRKPRIPEKNY